MLKVGLTGGIGCGKSIVASIFAELGVTVIDTDIIAREITKVGMPAFKSIVTKFGEAILGADGEINRKLLREAVFQNLADRTWLEELLHPLILAEMEQRAQQITASYCILVIPLLLEKNLEKYVDSILVVDCDREQQLKRAAIRDGASEVEIEAIIATQVSREQRIAAADDVLVNQGTMENLREQVELLHKKYSGA